MEGEEEDVKEVIVEEDVTEAVLEGVIPVSAVSKISI